MTEGHTEIIFCPICREEIHRHFAAPIYARASMPSRTHPHDAAGMLTAMMLSAEEEHQRYIRNAEEACAEHLQTRHARRYRLWRRLRWDFLIQRRWPWQRVSGELFDYSSEVNE